MATYSIDSTAQQLRGTGVVEPVREWLEDPSTGRRRPADTQARDDQGVPLWAVEAMTTTETYGRQQTAVVRVTVPSPQQPTVPAFEVLRFDGLTVAVSVNRAQGTLRETWTAAGMSGAGRPAAAAGADK